MRAAFRFATSIAATILAFGAAGARDGREFRKIKYTYMHARRMAERFEGAETVEMDSCHQVMAQRPKELAEILLRYA